MSAILQTHLATNALIAALRGGVGNDRKVYDHHVPENVSHPFALLTSVAPEGGPSGSHGDPESDIELAYGIDAVAIARLDAQWLGDKIRRVLMDRHPQTGEFKLAVSVPGWVNSDRRTIYGPGPIEMEGDRHLERFVQRTDYCLIWVPA